MHAVKVLLTIFLITLLFDEVFCETEDAVEKIDALCLGCICEASSNCDRSLGCVASGACGLFGIHSPYWIDGGQNVIANDNPDSKDAWIRCASNVFCAAKTVANYMLRYQADCNGDGKIDCIDYAWIHKLGPSGCFKSPKGSAYEKTLRQCLAS